MEVKNYYKPTQFDLAATVADGYDNNFRTLDETLASQQEATLSALDSKVDKIEGMGLSANDYTDPEKTKLAGIEARANAYAHPETHPADMVTDTADKVVMTATERAKLSEIAEGANNYTLPAATADVLGGVKAGDNVEIDAEGRISATAAPYDLPTASASVLGGVKVGQNLTIDADGRLNAPAGGGTGFGNSILVLPYVAAEVDADGNVTNSAAFVTAWGGLLSQYFAAPDSFNLYAEVSGGPPELNVRIPCNLVKVDVGEQTFDCLLSGFGVVNVPGLLANGTPCSVSCMAFMTCSLAGELQSMLAYGSQGFISADGQPNTLGGDNAVVIDITDVSTTESGQFDEAQIKAAVQPHVATLITNPKNRVLFKHGAIFLDATAGSTDADLWMSSFNTNPLACGNVSKPFTAIVSVYCRIQNGVIQTAIGGLESHDLATETYVREQISAAHPDYTSLEEQIVPGEFWLGADGVKRQVYVRTFKGVTPGTIATEVVLSTGVDKIITTSASMTISNYNSIPPGFIYQIAGTFDGSYLYYILVYGGNLILMNYGNATVNVEYIATIKYTKV